MGRDVAGAREQALMPRARAAEKKWSTAAKKLPSLVLGDKVLIQNQSGNHPRRWDKRGVVVEVLGFDQYQVRVEGSRRLTLRNRRFLRKYSQFHPTAFVTLPVNTELEPVSVPSQAKQVGTSTGRDGHGAVRVIPNQAGVPGHGGEEVQAEQPVQLVGGGAADRDMHVDIDRGGPSVDGQDDDHAVAVPSVGGDISQPEVSPVRRSSRSTKGVTTKYKDFLRFQD